MNAGIKRAVVALAWAGFAGALLLRLAPSFDYFAFGGSGQIDHGYQVALGQQVYSGAVPGRDFFTQYGPAIAWVSALSWSTGHVWLAEICSWCAFLAAGYGLLWWWVGHEAHPGRKFWVLLPAFFFTPYYAKYYFIFFPAFFLALLGDGPGDPAGDRRSWRWIAAGLIAGISGLFRIELGLALTATGAVFLGWDELAARRWPRAAGLLVAGAGAVMAGYFILMTALARDWSAAAFLDFEWAAIQGKFRAFSRYEASEGGVFHRGAAGFWALVGLAILYLTAAVAGMKPGWRSRYPRRMWAAALLGCALLPHLMHNTGVTYALQVGLPAYALVAAWCLANWPARPARTAAVLGLCLAAGIGLRAGGANYGYPGWRYALAVKLGSLVHETTVLRPTTRTPGLAATIQGITNADDRILILSLDSRFYALARRPWAGLLPHLAIPLPERWQERCVAQLRRQPPAVVIRPDANAKPGRFDHRGRNPLIEAFIDENYVATESKVKGWSVMVPRPTR